MRYLLVIICICSFLGCSRVNKYGFTDKIYSERTYSKSSSIISLREKIMILCIENGYKDWKMLSYRTFEYGLKDFTYISTGRARCNK